MDTFSHLVRIDSKTNQLEILRIFESGEQELLTKVDLPFVSGSTADDSVYKFAAELGENILMDSPVARKALRL